MAIVSTGADLHGGEVRGPVITLAGGTALAAAIVLLAAWKLPLVLVLPTVSLVLLATGFAVALAFWHRQPAGKRLSYRDVAGLFVLFGCVAAGLSDAVAFAAVLEAMAG